MEMLEALRTIESFIAEELETRQGSFLPDPDDGEAGYIRSARVALDAVQSLIARAEQEAK